MTEPWHWALLVEFVVLGTLLFLRHGPPKMDLSHLSLGPFVIKEVVYIDREVPVERVVYRDAAAAELSAARQSLRGAFAEQGLLGQSQFSNALQNQAYQQTLCGVQPYRSLTSGLGGLLG